MRNYNIDRGPVSGEEISTFKDFKSILRKHAQTTEDLAKIKPASSSSKLYWGIGSVITAITVSAVMIFGGDSNDTVTNSVLPVEEVVSNVVVETKVVEWQTIIRTPKNSIEHELGLNVISANRVDYVRFNGPSEVTSLLENVEGSDAKFVDGSLVFKIENEEELEISNANDLYRLNTKGQWEKIDYTPKEMSYVEKPVLLTKGDVAIQVNFNNFNGPASKYENVFWKPVNIKDLDESFFTTEWQDASVERTSVDGVYTLSFKSGKIQKRFNGFPALQKVAYEKALKVYNASLLKAQKELMVAPKGYKIIPGIYTVK